MAECQSKRLQLTHRYRGKPPPTFGLHTPQVNRAQTKGPLNKRAFFCWSHSDQNLNTSMSVRIGVAIGIFGFSGAAGLA